VDPPSSPLGRFSSLLETYHSYTRWQDAALRHVEAQSRQFDVVHHVGWGSLHLGTQLWRLPAPLVYGPAGGGQTAPAGYGRHLGRHGRAERARTAPPASLLKLPRRSRQPIRNSAVPLVTNSATAAACRRLGGTDIRYMLDYGLTPDWLAGPRRRPAGLPVV